MNLHGNSPQERAMQSLIHDTNNSLDRIEVHLKELNNWFMENHKRIKEASGEDISSKPYIHIEYIKTGKKQIQESIDLYYKQFAADFKQESTKREG